MKKVYLLLSLFTFFAYAMEKVGTWDPENYDAHSKL